MAHSSLCRWRSFYALTIVVLACQSAAHAQLPDFGSFGGALSDGKPVTLDAEFTPATADRPALVFVTATIGEGFHLFALDQGKLPDGGGPQVTTLTINDSDKVRTLAPFQALQAPKIEIDQLAWKGLQLREHEGKITWVALVEIAAGADVDSLTITGKLTGQACNANTCVDVPGLEFAATRGSGVALPAGVNLNPTVERTSSVDPQATPQSPEAPTAGAAEFGAAASGSASTAPESGPIYDIGQIRLTEAKDGSLVYYLLTALLGGLILNVMPCVLPVIGLKLMSFVQQAGESRHRALMLNVWYSAGIVAVFVALGLMAITLRVGWGDQFGNSWFLIALTAVVFSMALSLMGLWEIPIPGFVGSGAIMDAAHREGAPAAFLKGVLTTILATPCTGPFMVTGLAWAVKQPPHVTMAVFTAVGLGMASPYLLVGAFPSLIKFLPKPGMWMETFKKAMGLVLLATVVWLMSTLDAPLLAPTFALLVGVTAACWWIARVSLAEPMDKRLRAWAQAVAMILMVAAFSYGWFYPEVMRPRYERQLEAFAERRIAERQLEIAHRLTGVHDNAALKEEIENLVADVSDAGDAPWQSFSLPKLARLALEERRTVLVDFTADWCASCKFLEATVLKTDDVTKAIGDSGVVTMQADYTKKPVWMGETIKALGSIGVPVIAIFPADRPYHPIVFAGGYTKGSLIAAIEHATGRKSAAQTASRAPGANER